MRPYEAMVIFDAATDPPAIQAVVDRLLETIRTSEGAPGHVDRWGRRPFAYEVNHRREGYYMLVEFSGESRTVADVDRLLTLADEVLRFKVVRLPEKASLRAAAASFRGGGSGGGGPGAGGGRGFGRGGPGGGRPTREPRRAASGDDGAPRTPPSEPSSSEAAADGAPAAEG